MAKGPFMEMAIWWVIKLIKTKFWQQHSGCAWPTLFCYITPNDSFMWENIFTSKKNTGKFNWSRQTKQSDKLAHDQLLGSKANQAIKPKGNAASFTFHCCFKVGSWGTGLHRQNLTIVWPWPQRKETVAKSMMLVRGGGGGGMEERRGHRFKLRSVQLKQC